ncbi:MAG: glycosyltransferase [Pseudomonadota bacterium]
MAYPDFSILIATKDRPENMRKLLKSVEQSTIRPSSLVVVSSGHPIHDVISEFETSLKIDYVHSEVAGQVNQKKIGISRLRKEIPWVVFLDDDLLLTTNTFKTAFETLSKYSVTGERIVGIGLGLSPTSRMNRSSRFQNIVGRALRLSGATAGKVIRSGQGVSYLESHLPIYTEWLNGASIWERESALEYIRFVPSSKYAACEDLVFSFQQSKKGKLLFVPGARVFFQDTEPNDYNRSQAIMSGTAWRYFFVKTNPELSQWQLVYSQCGRLAYILVTQPRNQDAICAGIWSLRLLLSAIIRGKDPMFLINKIS